MNIHEYQAKDIFRAYALPAPEGKAAFSADEAVEAAKQLGGNLWVVKAQIHAGGRGKAGGVKLAKSLDEVKEIATELLGKTLVTHQTGPNGKEVQKIYVETGVDIQKEYYLSIVLDRESEVPMIVASSEGGVEIENVAEDNPDAILKVAIDPNVGFLPFNGREVAFGLGLEGKEVSNLVKFLATLYQIYLDKDASMVEINPLVKTSEGTFIALDAKVDFDGNALYRHADIEALRDFSEEEPTEVEAGKYNLNYVKLDGTVGCMVNGAGLAMATMDIIKHEGGEPANFLDVGGAATAETVAKGFEIILSDKNVSSIFVNIFGGIVRCDRVANGILQALDLIEVNVPIVVRLDGTNAIEAKELLDNANISNIITATSLKDGASKAVNAKGA